MNFGKRIDKLRRKLRCIQTELDTLLEMDRPPVNRVEKVRQRHAEASIELDDLDRIFKNRIFQKFGLDYYQQLEKQVAEEIEEDG